MRILGWVILRDGGSYPPSALPRESRDELVAARQRIHDLEMDRLRDELLRPREASDHG